MEDTVIILPEVQRLCQLSSYSRGFLSGLQIFKSIGPRLWISLVHKTPSYDTKGKTAFVKFQILDQNIDETHSKQQKFYIIKKSLKKSANQKSLRFPKRKPSLGYEFKNLQKMEYPNPSSFTVARWSSIHGGVKQILTFFMKKSAFPGGLYTSGHGCLILLTNLLNKPLHVIQGNTYLSMYMYVVSIK